MTPEELRKHVRDYFKDFPEIDEDFVNGWIEYYIKEGYDEAFRIIDGIFYEYDNID